MSQCMQFTFGDERDVYLLDKSSLPVTEKERFEMFISDTSDIEKCTNLNDMHRVLEQRLKHSSW